MPLVVFGLDISGALIWVATLLAALVGAWYGRQLQRGDARRDRLRALYADVMHTALLWTPPELGKRAPGQYVQPDPIDVDELVAKLMVEAPTEEDEVVKAFLGVQGSTTLYRIDKSNADHGMDVPTEELRKNKQAVYDSLSKLQAAMHKRLK